NDRDPYARGRVVDVSIGTAKVLHFYSRGLARVRVEYVGPAPLEGTDDGMLLATVREGSPAPAPSKVMVASAKPFMADPPIARERPCSVGRGPGRGGAQAAAGDVTSASRPQSRPGPSAAASPAPALAAVPAADYSPSRSEGPALGLMSGRGLY